MSETQTAVLTSKNGATMTEEVKAFPDNPEVIEIAGLVFVADNPVVRYGTDTLAYHEARGVYSVSP